MTNETAAELPLMTTYFNERPVIGKTYNITTAIENGAFSGHTFAAVCQRMVERKQVDFGTKWRPQIFVFECWEFMRTDTEESFVSAVEVTK